MRNWQKILTILSVVFIQSSAIADIVSWKCSYQPQTHKIENIQCNQSINDCSSQELICTENDEVLFKVSDFADHISVSDDHQYIVGLSNKGMTSAYWIRDRNGRVIKHRKHSKLFLHYCRESVTNIQEWFNEKEPNVRFILSQGKLRQVIVQGCDGKDINLL